MDEREGVKEERGRGERREEGREERRREKEHSGDERIDTKIKKGTDERSGALVQYRKIQ